MFFSTIIKNCIVKNHAIWMPEWKSNSLLMKREEIQALSQDGDDHVSELLQEVSDTHQAAPVSGKKYRKYAEASYSFHFHASKHPQWKAALTAFTYPVLGT